MGLCASTLDLPHEGGGMSSPLNTSNQKLRWLWYPVGVSPWLGPSSVWACRRINGEPSHLRGCGQHRDREGREAGTDSVL